MKIYFVFFYMLSALSFNTVFAKISVLNSNSIFHQIKIGNYLMQNTLKQPKEHSNICQVLVFIKFQTLSSESEEEDFQFLQFQATNIILTMDRLAYNIDEFSENNMTFFDRELSTEDVLKPLAFGYFRFVPNCVTAFIPSSNLNELFYNLNNVLSTKIARPHNDYFIFIGPDSVLNKFIATNRSQDIRFKYGIPVHNDRFPLSINNYCFGQQDKYFNLFKRDCPEIILAKHFRVTAVKSPGHARFTHDAEGRRITGAGVYFEMIQEAGYRNNFTFSIRYSIPGGASGFKKDGVWIGTIGEVFYRTMDIGITTAITMQRHLILDPTVVTSRITRVFYVHPPSAKTSWKSIFWPFSTLVWVAIGITCAAAFPAIYLATLLSYRFNPKQGKQPGNLFGHVAITILQIGLEQGLSINQWKSFCLRFLIIIWIVFSLIIGTGYRGNLVSFLTFRERDKIPKTHDELSVSDYRLLFRYYGGAAYLAFLNSPVPKHKRIIQKSTLVNSSSECIISTILETQTACLDYDFPGDFAHGQNGTMDAANPADGVLVKMSDIEFPTNLVWIFRKYSPLVEFFDKVVLLSQASGLLDFWIAKDKFNTKVTGARWLNSQSSSSVAKEIKKIIKENVSGARKMNLASLNGTFLLNGFGCAIAVVIFVLELLAALSRNVKKRKKAKPVDARATSS